MAEEEVLGEDDATQDGEAEDSEGEGDGGGLLGFVGGMNSTMIRILMGAIGVVALIFITVGVSYWTMQTWFLNSEPEQEQNQQQTPGVNEEPYQQFEMENDFIITKEVPGSNRTRTLKIDLVIAFNQENASVSNELEQRKSQIRSRIFQILGNKNAEQLGYDNMQDLRDELTNEINKMLTTGYRISTVYFNNYVYQ